MSYFYKNPNELKEKNGDWIHLRYPLNFDEPTEERWFHGSISSVQAEKLLMDSKVRGNKINKFTITKIRMTIYIFYILEIIINAGLRAA